MDATDKASSSTSSNLLDSIETYKTILVNNRLTLKSQVITQNKLEFKKSHVNSQTKSNSIVEGENPIHILGLPNEVTF